MISAATMRAADSVYLSDPVHGFISVPRDVLLPLLQTPHVQRLRRIRQLGVGFLVFPGAEHSRFTHATGAMALMQDALDILEGKGHPDLQGRAASSYGRSTPARHWACAVFAYA